jgi:hypothetical protein
VLGLSLALHHSLASYFEVVDYLQITPAWALPALLMYTATVVLGLFLVMIQVIVHAIIYFFSPPVKLPPGYKLNPEYKRKFFSDLLLYKPDNLVVLGGLVPPLLLMLALLSNLPVLQERIRSQDC